MPPQEAAQMRDPRWPVRAIKPAPAPASDWRMVLAPPEAEFGEFPPERDWFLVEKACVTGLSTHSRRRMIDAGEVYFAFLSYDRFHGGIKVLVKKAAALAQIVRFSTKCAGEIVKLSSEWTKCLVPLVNSSKVKIQGKIVFPTMELRLMQEILLYISYYIHKSVFTEGDNSSSNQLAPPNVDYSENPLRALFKLLKLRASHKIGFTLDDLTRKRSWKFSCCLLLFSVVYYVYLQRQ